jgi:serine phosphatase RsbU (regulator of sigma subunit)
MVMQFAGAYNPLYFIRNNELIQYKADRMPIGSHLVEKESFTNHTIQLKKDDVFYLFSDGYIDQFGGEKSNKFSSKAFRKLLLDIHKKTMAEQHAILEKTFMDWQGNNNQIDDVLVIGCKI